MPDRYGKLELRHLRYFVAVAEEGSLSEAARTRLHTAQPSLSRQLRELEDAVGVQLFERRSRGIVLTQSGRRFLEHSREILARIDQAVNDTRGVRTVLRVGSLPGLEPEVVPRVTQLAQAHAPDVEVRIVSASSPRLVEQLRAGELDMALMRQVEDATDLHFELVGSHRIVVLLPADHHLAKNDAVSCGDLRDQTYITVSRRAAPAVRSAVDAWCQQQGLTLMPSHSGDNIASALSLILTTHGFCIMPDYAGRLIPPTVIVRPLVDEPHPIPLVIAYRPKNPTPARFLVKAIAADWRSD
jgi:LysR family transcriptional regulator, hca operon transcriptional activator